MDTKIEIDRIYVQKGHNETIETHELRYTHYYEKLSEEQERRIRGLAQLWFPIKETHHGRYHPLSNRQLDSIDNGDNTWTTVWHITYYCPGTE
jgi:hypothetical protein